MADSQQFSSDMLSCLYKLTHISLFMHFLICYRHAKKNTQMTWINKYEFLTTKNEIFGVKYQTLKERIEFADRGVCILLIYSKIH